MSFAFVTKQNTKGFALLLSIILSSVVLAIGLSILRISVSQLQLSATSRESELALHASQSLNECLSYWRRKLATEYQTDNGVHGVNNPYEDANLDGITCMEAAPYASNPDPVGEYYSEVLERSPDGYVVKHYYTFEWDNDAGDGPFCSDGEIYFMVPNTGMTLDHFFDGTSVGDNGDGDKDCTADFCGVLVTRGYNRPCDKLQDSIFTVQRELTFEF